MPSVASLPTEVPALQQLVLELQHMVETLKEQLHLAYVPAAIKIIETRRQKYARDHCHGQIRRAVAPQTEPLAKGMASSSLLADLIVSNFADGMPLYRIARRLVRLDIACHD